MVNGPRQFTLDSIVRTFPMTCFSSPLPDSCERLPQTPKNKNPRQFHPQKLRPKHVRSWGQKHQFRPSSPSEKSIQTLQNIPKLEHGNGLNPSFTSQCQSPAPASETVPAGKFRASGFLSENFRVDVTSSFSP